MSYLRTDAVSSSVVTGNTFRKQISRPLTLVTHGFKVQFKPKSMGRQRNQDVQTTTSIATQSYEREKKSRFGVAKRNDIWRAKSRNDDIDHLRVSENFSA